MTTAHRRHGVLLILMAVCFNATIALFVKLSGASIFTLVFVRFIIGTPLFLWMTYRKNIRLSWKDLPKNATRSIAGILTLYSAYFALQKLPLINAITLSNTAPLFLPILYLIWDKLLVSKRKFLATGIGFLGVCVILRPSTNDFLLWGSIFGLISGFCKAVSFFNVRMLAKTEKTEVILSYYFCIGAVLSFFPFWLNWDPLKSPIQWIYVCITGILALGYQYGLTRASAHIAATTISSLTYLTVILGGFFGWLVFGEIPDFWVIIGTALVILGALIAVSDLTPPKRLKKI